MSVDDPHGFSDRLERLLTEDIPALSHREDKILLKTYIKKLRKSQSEGTVYNNAMRVQTLCQYLDNPFVDATEYELEEAIDQLSAERNWSNGTERNYGKAARAVIKKTRNKTKRDWDFAADPDYIELAAQDSEDKITEDDVFSRDQVRLMVEEAARNERDRMLFGLLLDMGLRVAGICTLRVDDYEYIEEDGVGTLQLNPDAVGTKGAEGKVQVTTWSTPYIERYLRGDHPRPDDDDAPLLHKHNWGEGDPTDDGSFTPPVVRRRLRRITREYDEIPNEKVNPHTFRHTAVTLWALRGLSDREIVHRAGWSRESGQLERYEHLTDKDINDEILRRHGIEPSDDSVPLVADCPQCGMSVEPVMTYCANCGQNLDVIREKPQWFEDMRDELGDDDDLVEYLMENQHYIKEDIHDLPQRIYQRVQSRMQAYMRETGQAMVGESFVLSGAPVGEVYDELDIDIPENIEDDREATVTMPDGEEFQIPYSEIKDIEDQIHDFERVTEMEFVALDAEGSAIRVVSILDN